MKTIVSKRFRLNSICALAIISICNLLWFWISIPLCDTFFEFLPFLGFAFLFWIIYFLIILIMYKGLLTVHLSDVEFVSAFYKKTYCKVSKSKPIFYIRFRTNDDIACVTEYIIVSNEPIHCRQAIELLLTYRLKTQIVIPYNEQTEAYMDLDHWTLCYPKKRSFFN